MQIRTILNSKRLLSCDNDDTEHFAACQARCVVPAPHLPRETPSRGTPTVSSFFFPLPTNVNQIWSTHPLLFLLIISSPKNPFLPKNRTKGWEGIIGYERLDIRNHLDFISVPSGPATSSQDPNFLPLETSLRRFKRLCEIRPLRFKSTPGLEGLLFHWHQLSFAKLSLDTVVTSVWPFSHWRVFMRVCLCFLLSRYQAIGNC